MLNMLESHLHRRRNLLLLIGRLLLSLIFLHEAVTIATSFPSVAAAMGKAGIPPAVLAATILLQGGAGAMLLFGWHGRLGAVALALFCIATAFLFHANFANRGELLHFEKDLAIAGGMFIVAAAGTGRFSLQSTG